MKRSRGKVSKFLVGALDAFLGCLTELLPLQCYFNNMFLFVLEIQLNFHTLITLHKHITSLPFHYQA